MTLTEWPHTYFELGNYNLHNERLDASAACRAHRSLLVHEPGQTDWRVCHSRDDEICPVKGQSAA